MSIGAGDQLADMVYRDASSTSPFRIDVAFMAALAAGVVQVRAGTARADRARIVDADQHAGVAATAARRRVVGPMAMASEADSSDWPVRALLCRLTADRAFGVVAVAAVTHVRIVSGGTQGDGFDVPADPACARRTLVAGTADRPLRSPGIRDTEPTAADAKGAWLGATCAAQGSCRFRLKTDPLFPGEC